MKKKKKYREFIGICLLVSIIIILVSFFISTQKKEPKPTNTKLKEDKEEILYEKQEENYQATMIMVGDNLIHSSIYKDAYLGNDNYDFTKMYSLVKPIITSYDIAYYNQETILGGKELGLSDYPTFNSPTEVGDAMIDAGFNLVSLATNHTLDRGEQAIINSKNYWNSKENILAVGSYTSRNEKNNFKIMEKNNITYTMLNYTYGTNGIKVPNNKEYLVNVWPVTGSNPINDDVYQTYKKQVKLDVESVRDKVDILIVAMHWGIEYTHEPTAYQKDMASFLASLDVDIVIGTHPHVIQPITWIDNTIVFYSLGNFISAQYQNEYYNKVIGLMSSLEIRKKVLDDEVMISIENIDNELIYTYYKNWRNFKVIPFSNKEISNYLPDYQNVYNKYKSIVQKYDNQISVKTINND